MNYLRISQTMSETNQQKIAKSLKLTPSFFSQLLNGKRNLRYPDAVRISERLKCKPDIWMDGGGTPDERRKAVSMIEP